VEVTSQGDARFSTTLELAVRFGKTLVVAEVDRVEAVLYPLLRRDLVLQGGRPAVHIGEKTVSSCMLLLP
jgi:dynein heavy chain 2